MPAAFEAHSDVDGDVARIHLIGEIDLATRDAFDAVVTAHLARLDVTTVLLNLSAVTFLDSTGIGTLVGCHQRAQTSGRRLFIYGAHGQVEDVLTLTGAATLLALPTAHDA